MPEPDGIHDPVFFHIKVDVFHGDMAGDSVGPHGFQVADLTGDIVQVKSDGALFLAISYGVPGTMPALNENLTVRDRWDVVNFIRTLAP